MKSLKSKLLVLGFIMLLFCFAYCNYTYAAVGVTLNGEKLIKDGSLSTYLYHKKSQCLDEFLNSGADKFLNKSMSPGSGANHSSNIKCANATCMFHQQATVSGTQYKIAHVIDIDDSVLKVNGTTININDSDTDRVAKQKSITQMAYAAYNAYENGSDYYNETKAKYAFRYTLLYSKFKSLLGNRIDNFITGSGNTSKSMSGDKQAEYNKVKGKAYFEIEKSETTNEPSFKSSGSKKLLGPFKVKYSNYSGVHKIKVQINGVTTNIDTEIDGYYVYDTEAKTYKKKIGSVPSSKGFYIKVPNTGTNWKVTLTTNSKEKYKVRILLFKNSVKSGQNIAVFGGKKYSESDKIEWEGQSEEVGKLVIYKKDSYTGEGLAGAKFIIRNVGTGEYIRVKDSKYIGTASYSTATRLKSSETGKIVVKNLPFGTYEIEEIVVPSGYIGMGSTTVNINSTTTKTVNISNAPESEYATIKITKLDKDGGQGLEGAGFKIRVFFDDDEEDDKPIRWQWATGYQTSNCYYFTGFTDNNSYGTVFYSNESGIVNLRDLAFPGISNVNFMYAVDEIYGPTGYNIYSDPDYYYNYDAGYTCISKTGWLNGNAVTKVKFYNSKTGEFHLRKANQHGYPLEASFQMGIEDEDTDEIKYITGYNSDGVAQFGYGSPMTFYTSNGSLDVYGLPLFGEESYTYILTEVWNSYGNVDYQINKEVEVEVSDSYYSYTMKNIETGRANIRKVDASNGVGLSEVVYLLYDNSKGQYLRVNNLDDASGIITILSYEDIEYVSQDDATSFITDSNGNTQINGIPTGSYKFVELSNGSYGFKGNQGVTVDINVISGYNSFTIDNIKHLGNLNINKVDSLNSDVHLSGVNFKVMLEDEGAKSYLQLVDSSGHIYENENVGSNVTIDENNVTKSGLYTVNYVQLEEDATIFTTDSNGQIYINNLEVYCAKDVKYKYYISEISMGDLMDMYYDVKSEEDAINDNTELAASSSGTTLTTAITIQNKQLRVDLTGYIWEDIIDNSKLSPKNDHYDDGETRIEGIPVTLYKNNEKYAETKTDSNGAYFFPAKGTWNGNKYTIDLYANGSDEPGSGLLQYTIEFEYNGLKYQSVIRDTGTSENGSKAYEEGEKDGEVKYRDKINDNFYNIQGNGSKSGNSTTGKTSTDVKLSYDSDEEHKSKLIQYMGYTTEPKDNKIVVGNSSDEYRKFIQMMALIANNTIRQHWSYGVWTVKSLNLGIYERPQTDMAIASDIDNIQLTINGKYIHKYMYQKRLANIKEGIPDADINPGYDVALDAFSVGVKNSQDYKAMSYVRDIYDSYIAYTKYEPDSENRLRVYVTYYIVVKNESNDKLVSKVSLNNYADTRLENPESYYMDGNNKVTVNWNKVSDGMWQTGVIDKGIKQGECITIYLKYELNTDTIVNLATLGKAEELTMKHNVSEINSYSTFDKDGNKYGTIDKDSAPNNIVYDTVDTYEDDTDAAPDLRFKRKDSKEISGLVFEDNPEGITKNSLNSGKERKGNGKHEEGENTVENAEVKIVNCDKNETAMLYKLDNSGNVNVEEAKLTTGPDGIYSFVGLVPDEYYMQYKYGYYNGTQTKIGDIDVTTEGYKSTIINQAFSDIIEKDETEMKANYDAKKAEGDIANALWYWYENPENFKYSLAIDDYEKREQINKSLSDIKYNTKSDYDNKVDNLENHYMDAKTAIFDFPIEDIREQTTDLNYIEGSRNYQIKFGIIERPKQNVELNKEISYVRIILANGQILVEGDPRKDEINYVTYPNGGILKIEIDNEIVQGAKLELEYEITVTNKSEIDYDAKKYYVYGDSSGLTPVKIELNSIVDYVDEKLSVTYDIDKPNSDFVYYDSSQNQNDKWMIIVDPSKENNKLANIEIDPAVYNSIKSRKNMVVKNLSGLEISPIDNPNTEQNETQAMVKLSAMKLLTDVSDSDQIFDNYAELLGVKNPIGRFYGQMSNGKWQIGTPGNFNIYNPTENDECDNNSYTRGSRRAQATIVPPTGSENIIIYILIGIGCLVILSGGIILIKKKVL